ncbi:MAG: GlsB/YeaQ/YmgE family stress response membrane protein [Patescibacteria group bacterium]
MALLSWLVLGALAGWIASIIMGTNAQQGAVMNVIVGIVGAVLGGWIMSLFGTTGVDGFNVYSLIVAIVGAVVLLALVRAVRGASSRSHRTAM